MKSTGRALFAFVLFFLVMSAGSQWWAGRQEGALGAEVARLAQPGDIRMISSDSCVPVSSIWRWMALPRVSIASVS